MRTVLKRDRKGCRRCDCSLTSAGNCQVLIELFRSDGVCHFVHSLMYLEQCHLHWRPSLSTCKAPCRHRVGPWPQLSIRVLCIRAFPTCTIFSQKHNLTGILHLNRCPLMTVMQSIRCKDLRDRPGLHQVQAPVPPLLPASSQHVYHPKCIWPDRPAGNL